MQLINERYRGIDTEDVDEDLYQHFFEYDPKEEDMFLVQKNFWYESDPVRWYTLLIGKRTIRLPGHLYIMIGDVYSSSVDWVPVEELFNRELTTFVYPNTLTPEGWCVETIQVMSADEELKSCQLPFSKNIVPVLLGDDKSVFMSDSDCYSKTKNIAFPNFI